MKLGTKIILGFSSVITIALVMAGLSMWSMTQANTKISAVLSESLPAMEATARVEQNVLNTNHAVEKYALTQSPADMDTARKHLNEVKTSLAAARDLVQRTDGDGRFRNALDQMTGVLNTYGVLVEPSSPSSKITAERRNDLEQQLMTAARQLSDVENKSTEQLTTSLTRSMASSINLTLIGACCGLVVTGLVAWGVCRSITRPITRVAEVLSEGFEETKKSATQVSTSSQSLAQGATEQAAALTQTSSAMEEMGSMTRKNAETAREASTLSSEAQKAASRGNDAMSRMNGAINQIQRSASETAKIIKVIDEIAFQTNLLALNAAVEAARAGEAGKGFAVVAEEVRNLAMRSADAAKNTASMIEESVNSSKNGVTISTEVAKMLQEITGSTTKVNALVGEIAAASREQSIGIEQMATAMAQMDKVTQTNALSAEQSASASEALEQQAEQVSVVVGELFDMVRGAGVKPVSSRTTNVRSATRAAPVHATEPRADRQATALRAPAARAKRTAPTEHAKSPADVFPLDDDAGVTTTEFSEFNKAA